MTGRRRGRRASRFASCRSRPRLLRGTSTSSGRVRRFASAWCRLSSKLRRRQSRGRMSRRGGAFANLLCAAGDVTLRYSNSAAEIAALEISLRLCHRLRHGPNIFEEKLGERGERSIFQGDDPNRRPRIGQCDGQRLERWISSGHLQPETRKDREKAPRREQIVFHVLRQGRDRGARRLVSAGAKGLIDKSAEEAVRRQQRPWFVHQLGPRELAAARQR